MLINEILLEDLGNLASLQLGPLIGLLKQSRRADKPGVWGNYLDPGTLGSRFGSNTQITPNSPIIDAGVLKDPLKNTRKLFRDNPEAKAIAIYIGGKAVLFALTSQFNLAGRSRNSTVSYDLTPWRQTVGQRYNTVSVTTDYEKTDYKGTKSRNIRKEISTDELDVLLAEIKSIATEANQPITAKLVLQDPGVQGIRRERYLRQQLETSGADLKTRLAIYKNAKKPTVDTIEQFVKYSLANPGKIVRFANKTYKLDVDTFTKIDPDSLLKGKSFIIKYKCVDPNAYDTIDITYVFDYTSNALVPIFARWQDKTGDMSVSEQAVLEPAMYFKKTMGPDALIKTLAIPKLLDLFKQRQYKQVRMLVDAYAKLVDWPELATIRKSAEHEITQPSN